MQRNTRAGERRDLRPSSALVPRFEAASIQLKDQIVLITGGARGIGRRAAELFAEEGATVAIADVAQDDGIAVARTIREAGGDAEFGYADITEPSSVTSLTRDLVERRGRIDVLIHSAGIDGPPGCAWKEDDEHWRRIIDADLNGAWWCAKAVIPHMIESGQGRIIFVSSVAAWRWSGGSVAYNAAKAGVVGLTYALASELERHGLLVNAIAPGPTGSTGQRMTAVERNDVLLDLPLGFGGPDPVAQACLYLSAASGSWISGSVLNVSGGYWKR